MEEDGEPHQIPSGSNKGIPSKLSNVELASLQDHQEKGVCLGKDYQLKIQDVICGVERVKQQQGAIRHPGNERLRILADLSIGRYRKATERREKFNIVKEIVEAVSVSGGKFVRQHNNGIWYEVGIVKARETAGYALRNALGKVKKPLAAAKRQRLASWPSEIRKKRVSFDLSSQPRQVSTASSVAQMDHQFSHVESIDPDPISHERGRPSEWGRPAEPEGLREFVRARSSRCRRIRRQHESTTTTATITRTQFNDSIASGRWSLATGAVHGSLARRSTARYGRHSL